MKSYDEVARRVIERRNEHKTAKIQTAKKGVLCVTLILCLCVVASYSGAIQKKAFESGVESENQSSDVQSEIQGDTDLQSQNAPQNNWFMMPYNQDGDIKMTKMISDFECEEAAPIKYKAPSAGEVLFTIALSKAMEKYGDEALYNVKIEILVQDKYVSDDILKKEIDRLTALGYTTVYEDYYDGTNHYYTFSCHATEGQLKSFPAESRYGYFISLHDEEQNSIK